MAGAGSRLTGLVLALILVTLAGVAVAWFVGFPWTHSTPDANRPGTEAPAAGIPSRPNDAFALTITYVYDGDTVQAQMVEPNEVVTTADAIRIRLIGIDTPEGTPTPECWADEARARLTELLPAGARVWAAPDSELRDRYDRALLYLWTDDGRFVNYELVAAGAAESLRIAPNTRYAELLRAAQAEAEASRAGQWAAC